MVVIPGTESAKIRTFRLGMARSIPRVPNNAESLRILEQKPLGEVLIDYLGWRARYVAPRPRAVIIDPVAWSDPNWNRHHAAIRGFLEKVRQGEDLTPHLSLRPHTKGFSSAAGRRGAPPADRWSDKDMLLNAKGYHHFHPNLEIGPKGFAKRASDVVIAEVTRSEFVVIGVFDHSVFQTMPDGSLTPERERFWRAADERASRGVPAGAVVLDGPGIATSCHSLPVCFRRPGMRGLSPTSTRRWVRGSFRPISSRGRVCLLPPHQNGLGVSITSIWDWRSLRQARWAST